MQCVGNMGVILRMKLIINRIEDWFNTDFPELDNYYICAKLLDKLSTNRKRGVVYDKLKLINIVSPTQSKEMMIAIDKAVIFLIARGLIEKRKISDFRLDLFITSLGMETLKRIGERKNEID